MSDRAEASRWPIIPDLLVGAIVLAGAAGGLRVVYGLNPMIMPLSLLGYAGLAMLLWWYRGFAPLTPADRITLGRAVLTLLLLGLLPAADAMAGQAALVFALGFVAVALDGVDGWVARRLHCVTAAGARFDMELDALLLLILCGWLVLWDRVGAWVLLIGAWRYVFIALGVFWPELRKPLPPSQRRRVICAVQGLGLVLCLIPELPSTAVPPIAAGLLGLLSYSFITDMTASWRAAKQ